MALVAVLTFVLMRLLPGDPAIQLLGDRATDANIARLRHELGFDRSVAVQFWTYLTHVATLRLGASITLHAPVTQLIVFDAVSSYAAAVDCDGGGAGTR